MLDVKSEHGEGTSWNVEALGDISAGGGGARNGSHVEARRSSRAIEGDRFGGGLVGRKGKRKKQKGCRGWRRRRSGGGGAQGIDGPLAQVLER